MNSPIHLSFFKKLELYQELRSRDSRIGGDKAWSGEKEILKWTVKNHRHLGTPINVEFVQTKILTDPRYNNFPDDAQRPLENLIVREYAEPESVKVRWQDDPTRALRFRKEGLLMGEVIYDVENGKSRRYKYIYWLAWATAISGVLIVIAPVVRFLLLFILHTFRFRWLYRNYLR
jgi:hypothetical protein